MVKNNINNSNPRLNRIFNITLVIICLILIFVGKLDLIAIRNISSFFADFFAPVSKVVNIPAKELENVIEDVQSATQLRKENLRINTQEQLVILDVYPLMEIRSLHQLVEV